MIELCLRSVPGFSTQEMLAPRGWTMDVATHHVQHSTLASTAATRAIMDSELPPGSSSNTARFEAMMDANDGSLLYMTELFLPHAGTTSGVWSAERLRSCLQATVKQVHVSDNTVASSSPNDISDSSSQVWVTELTHSTREAAVVRTPPANLPPSTAPSTTLYDAFSPFFRVFLEVVWLPKGKSAAGAPFEETVRRILADWTMRYHTPTLEMNGFACFAKAGAVGDPLQTAAAASSVPSANATAAPTDTSLTAASSSRREPCAPAALADLQACQLSSVWISGLYTAAGAAFVQLLSPDLTQQDKKSRAKGRVGGSQQWYLDVPPRLPSSEDASPGDPIMSAARAARHLLERDLHLNWENLLMSTTVPRDNASEQRAVAQTDNRSNMDVIVLAVATLPLDSSTQPSSLYSFPSVEQSLEAHVAQCLDDSVAASSQCPEHPTRIEKGHHCLDWSMTKLPSNSSVLSLEALEAALEEVEAQQFQADNADLTTAEQAVVRVQEASEPSPMPPRCASYLLCITRGTTSNGEASTDRAPSTTEEEVYVVRLHAPRVLSRHAVVVCMPVPSVWCNEGLPDDLEKEKLPGLPSAAYGWASTLTSLYRVSPYAPSLWLPRELARADRTSSGVCGRSGRLVLHVANNDAIYANLRLSPVGANAFTSLGSVTAWVEGASASAAFQSPPATTKVSSEMQARVAVMWTLVGDGRSAAAYLEDALQEYCYDMGSKTLLNVGLPSQHERRPGVFVVQRRTRCKVKSASGHAAIASQEVCAAWVNVGTRHRLYLIVRDVGVGEVVVGEASLVGPFPTEGESAAAAAAGGMDTERLDEQALECWMAGMTVGAIPKHYR